MSNIVSSVHTEETVQNALLQSVYNYLTKINFLSSIIKQWLHAINLCIQKLYK